jgi:hypothetical protein
MTSRSTNRSGIIAEFETALQDYVGIQRARLPSTYLAAGIGPGHPV